MPAKLDKPYQIRLSEDFWRDVDDWRAAQRPVPTRAEAIRQLVELALKSELKRRR